MDKNEARNNFNSIWRKLNEEFNIDDTRPPELTKMVTIVQKDLPEVKEDT